MINLTANQEPEAGVVVVSPINRLRGDLRLPGDKSISHRAAMVGALARGESTFKNFSTAQDCEATLDCLQALGVRVVRDGSTVTVGRTGATDLRQPEEILNARNSGTTMRLLAGILAGQPFTSTITGDDSLLRRPMLRVAEPLRLMGAKVELQANHCGPIKITGQRFLQPISYRPSIASAQIKSAVLLATISGNCGATIEEPTKTRDHLERMLGEFGSSIRWNDKTIIVYGDDPLHSCDLVIPGDISSAAFFIAAAVVLPGSDLSIRNVGLNPTRTAFISLMSELGANINVSDKRLESSELVGSVHVSGSPIKKKMIEVCGSNVSSLIDELPLLAFFAASVGCGMKLREASELRVKESDRIAATVENLTRMGASIVEREDGWSLQPGARLRGAQLRSFGDHRIAMSCAVAALSAQGPSQIEDGIGAVAVSLPEFWTLLESVAE